MKKATIRKTLDNLEFQIYKYNDTLRKISEIKELSSEEIEDTFECYLLRISAAWERFIEDIFIDSFNQNTTEFANHT